MDGEPRMVAGGDPRKDVALRSTRLSLRAPLNCVDKSVGLCCCQHMSEEVICTCNADGIREVEARRLRIMRRMRLNRAADLTSAIVLSLAFDFRADAWISADMWFGVSLETPLHSDGLYVECDWPGDGLAFMWEKFADMFPECVTVNVGAWFADIQAVEATAYDLMKEVDRGEKDREVHKLEKHAGEYVHECAECRDGIDRAVAAHHALEDFWGAESLDLAIDKAFS